MKKAFFSLVAFQAFEKFCLKCVLHNTKWIQNKLKVKSPRLREWSGKYIMAIKKYRPENCPIIYLGETWFDSYDTTKKGLHDFWKNVKQRLFQIKTKEYE